MANSGPVKTNLASTTAVNGVTGTLPIANGGTGQITAQAAIDALLPSQASANGKYLTSNGTTSSWGTVSSGVTSSYLAATSSTKTPVGNNQYLQMTGNTVTLTAGDWMLTGSVLFNNAGAVSYTETDIIWCGANGADSGSAPTTIASVATIQAGTDTHYFDNATTINSTAFYTFPASTMRVSVSGSTAIYLVPFVAATTSGNARVTTYIYAQRMA